MEETLELDPRLGIGANHPPEPTPLEAAQETIDALYGEAVQWLDGAAIDNPETANGVAKLLVMLRDAENHANLAREADKRPHLEAGRAVDNAYRPTIKKASTAADACRAALKPWLEAAEEQIRQTAEAKRKEASAALLAAQEAIRTSDRTNLAEVEAAEAILVQAKRIDAAASAWEKTTASAGIERYRVSLRGTPVPVLKDAGAALAHYRTTAPFDVLDWLQRMAEKDIRSGKRDIPGFTVAIDKRPV